MPERGSQLVPHDSIRHSPAQPDPAPPVVAHPTTHVDLLPLQLRSPPETCNAALKKNRCVAGASNSQFIPRPERRSNKRYRRLGAVAVAELVVGRRSATVVKVSQCRECPEEPVKAANVVSGGNVTRGNVPGCLCSAFGRASPSTSSASAEEHRPGQGTDGVSEGPEETPQCHRGAGEYRGALSKPSPTPEQARPATFHIAATGWSELRPLASQMCAADAEAIADAAAQASRALEDTAEAPEDSSLRQRAGV
ncbi:uncharacterized protein LOC144107221 [Amblyomma americanum]